MFIDFENLGLGFNGRRDRFDIDKVLERLVEKGKIVAKKAYADWSRFGDVHRRAARGGHRADRDPAPRQTGKNSADIRLCVDAMDLAYSKDHIDTFVIVSGDSDFSPLVSKLKELGKHVIGLGMEDSTSDLLRDNCDEFIYYEDLDRAPIIPVAVNDADPGEEAEGVRAAARLAAGPAAREQGGALVVDGQGHDEAEEAVVQRGRTTATGRSASCWRTPQKEGLLELEKHKTSGTYVVTRFGLEMKPAAPACVPAGRERQRRAGDRRSRSRAQRPRHADRPRGRAAERTATPPAGGRSTPPGEARATPPPAPRRRRRANRPRRRDRPLGRALVEEIDELDDGATTCRATRRGSRAAEAGRAGRSPTQPPSRPAASRPRSPPAEAGGRGRSRPAAARSRPPKPARRPAEPARAEAGPAARPKPPRAQARARRPTTTTSGPGSASSGTVRSDRRCRFAAHPGFISVRIR